MANREHTAHRKTVKWREGRSLRQFGAFVCCLVFIVLCAALFRVTAQSAPVPAAQTAAANSATPVSTGTQQYNPQAANTPADSRIQQLAGQCADLLKLATDLKAQVDKSTKDQLSVKVVRDAGQIEKLAHKVKSTGSKD